jgi:hypothetical protein
MRRGAEISARWAEHEKANHPDEAVEARREIIRRWEEGCKVQIVNHFEKRVNIASDTEGWNGGERHVPNKAAVVNGVEVAIERFGPSWPSEQYVAQVALAIGAMSSFDGVPEMSLKKRNEAEERARALQERARRDEYRKQQSQWKKIYEPDDHH